MDNITQATKDICQYHMNDHAVISDLKDAVKVIIDGQQDMRSSIVQLTEAFKNMDRIENKMEKLEEERRAQDRLRDKEIQELRTFMNKTLGVLSAIVLIGTIALKFVGV